MAGTSATNRVPKKCVLQPQSLPSPALCCACGMCFMLAGVNITLVGAFAFDTFIPKSNPLIIIGPLLLLVAFATFAACCLFSRRPPAQVACNMGGESWRLLQMGAPVFEIETSEHTVQDTTVVQLSPTSSPTSSHNSSSSHKHNPSLLVPGNRENEFHTEDALNVNVCSSVVIPDHPSL